MTRDQDTLIQRQTRLESRLTACLTAYYPAALTLSTKLQQKSTLLFLQTYPTPQAASKEQLSLLLKQAGHPMLEQIKAYDLEGITVIGRLYIPRFCSAGTIPLKDGVIFWHRIFFESRSKALASLLETLSPAWCQHRFISALTHVHSEENGCLCHF